MIQQRTNSALLSHLSAVSCYMRHVTIMLVMQIKYPGQRLLMEI